MNRALQTYRSGTRATGVTEFALLPDAILVLFQDGAAYLYTASHTGAEHVRRMAALAQQGRGLSTYISRHVSTAYAEKLSSEQVATVRREMKQ